MRYRRAIAKLQALAEACESVKGWPPGDPFLLAAYVSGDVLQGAQPSPGVRPLRADPAKADRCRCDKRNPSISWSALPN